MSRGNIFEKILPNPTDSSEPSRDSGTENLLEQIRSEHESYTTTIEGKEFIVFPNVYSPKYSNGTAVFAKNFPYQRDEDVLEIGTGIGAISILIAYNGARRVVATDINPDAVRNTQANIALHHMEERIEVREGSLYEPLRADEKFNTIFWNVPYCFTDENSISDLEKAVYDPGYRAIEEFIKGAKDHLTETGRVLIGFSTTLGRVDLLEKFLREAGMSLRIISETTSDDDPPIKTEIFEAVPEKKDNRDEKIL